MGHFNFGWPAILWRAAADDVGASIIGAPVQSMSLQEFVQGLPGSADEAFSLPVFFGAWGFTDNQHFAGFSDFGEVWCNDAGARNAQCWALSAGLRTHIRSSSFR